MIEQDSSAGDDSPVDDGTGADGIGNVSNNGSVNPGDSDDADPN